MVWADNTQHEPGQDRAATSLDKSVPLILNRSAGTVHLRLRVGHHPSRSFEFRVLADSGSAITWLPASRLRLAGGSRGAACVPTGSNFTQHYIDGSRIHGVHCMAELHLQRNEIGDDGCAALAAALTAGALPNCTEARLRAAFQR